MASSASGSSANSRHDRRRSRSSVREAPPWRRAGKSASGRAISPPEGKRRIVPAEDSVARSVVLGAVPGAGAEDRVSPPQVDEERADRGPVSAARPGGPMEYEPLMPS